MRKILALMAVAAVMAYAVAAGAASSISGAETYSRNTPRESVQVITVTWVAHTDGTVTAETIDIDPQGYVFMVVTNPGGTAPTTLYDITLTDADGVDIMGGKLADRSATASEQAIPAVMTGVYGGRYVIGGLTLNISNNSVNGAGGTVVIYVAR